MGVLRHSRTGLAALLIVGVFWVPPTVAAGAPRAMAGWGLAAVVAAAMMLRRWRPVAATVVAGVATLVGNALGVCEDPMLAVAWCLYPLAEARAARTGRLVLVFAGLLALLAAVTAVPGGSASGMGQRFVVAVAALSVSWVLGTTVGRQIVTAREAERARVQLEVARDVHDVVGHALGVISAEAGVTRALDDAGEDELRESLGGIEKQARQALEEIQGLVRGLRSEPDLERVIAATRAAGIDVVARIGTPRPPDAVLYRIVQESLTNVVRHAPGSACTVDVRQDGDEIVVRVRDRGPGAPADAAPGFGLTGMRERARLRGGEVTWGNHPEGGFQVSARLPVREAR